MLQSPVKWIDAKGAAFLWWTFPATSRTWTRQAAFRLLNLKTIQHDSAIQRANRRTGNNLRPVFIGFEGCHGLPYPHRIGSVCWWLMAEGLCLVLVEGSSCTCGSASCCFGGKRFSTLALDSNVLQGVDARCWHDRWQRTLDIYDIFRSPVSKVEIQCNAALNTTNRSIVEVWTPEFESTCSEVGACEARWLDMNGYDMNGLYAELIFLRCRPFQPQKARATHLLFCLCEVHPKPLGH